MSFEAIISAVSGFLWTYLMIALLLGTAFYFSIRTRFVQFRRLGEMIRLLGEGAAKGVGRTKTISSFQAFCISLASRVGTGNLAGVAIAIYLGGPGAVFWMWVIALFGSVSAFIESTLAQIFKERGEKSFIGGPAYYIRTGLGSKWMAVLFGICITLTFGLVFNSVQTNTISLAFQSSFGIAPWITGAVLTAATLIIIFGGVHRIAAVSSVIVPFMAGAYILLALFIVIMNITRLPEVIELIVGNAFGWHQAVGGSVGAALLNGIKRGLYSNEAGMGSAPNAAATADISHPVKQGFIQALGVFTDTLVICTCTAFIILFSAPESVAGLSGIQLTQAALSNEIGSIGSMFITIAVFFFAYTTVIGNYYYGEANILYFSRKKWVLTVFRLAAAAMVMAGSFFSLGLIWDMADIMMAIMATVNLIAILLLGNYAIKAYKDYSAQKKAGIKDPVFYRDTIPELADKITCWPDRPADAKKK
jgi:AGCS family alanine or glycine:cation symporter